MPYRNYNLEKSIQNAIKNAENLDELKEVLLTIVDYLFDVDYDTKRALYGDDD